MQRADILDIIADLPTLGVGASLSLAVAPDAAELAAQRGGPSFVEYAGAVDYESLANQVDRIRRQDVPVLYHPSCLNLCGSTKNPPHWLRAVNRHVRSVGSPWLAQDVAICFTSTDPGYSIQLGYFIPPILTEDSLAIAIDRVQEVRAVVDAPLLLEPSPVTFQFGELSVFEWLNRLADATGCGLLLDAGHVVSHQLARGVEATEGLDVLNTERIVELHIAGGVIETRDGRDYYVDAHDLPILPEAWRIAGWVLDNAPNLKAVCFECEGAMGQTVLPVLRQVRERVAHATVNAELERVVDDELSAT